MLASMRTAAHSFVMKALLILLVISFAVWGVGDVVRSGNSTTLASVGSEKVTYPEFARQLNFMERSMQAMGMNLDRRVLEDDLLRRMIEEKLILLRLRELGLDVNDQLLVSRLRDAPMFKDIRGKFDPALFRETLNQRQISEAAFLEQLKADIRATVLTTSLSAEDIKTPESYQALLDRTANETRDGVLITIPVRSVTIDPITEDDVKEAYDRSKELLYMQPERRTLEYVTLSTSDLQTLIDKQVTDDLIQERFEMEPERFADRKAAEKPLREELRAELADTALQDLSMNVEDALAAGDSMGEALAKAGVRAQSRQLSNVTADPVKDPLASAVTERGFALGENETSGLETTESGAYYMVSVKSITPAAPAEFNTVEAQVRKHVTAQRQQEAVNAKAKAVKAALADADDWQQVLREQGLSGRVVRGVKRTGASGPVPALLAQSMFERNIGEVAGPLVQQNGDAQLALVTASQAGRPPAARDPKQEVMANEALSREIIVQYFTELSNSYPINVNQPLIDRMRAQGEQE